MGGGVFKKCIEGAMFHIIKKTVRLFDIKLNALMYL